MDQLGIDIGDYYASERDGNATAVSNLRYPSINYVDDVKNLTESDVSKWVIWPKTDKKSKSVGISYQNVTTWMQVIRP